MAVTDWIFPGTASYSNTEGASPWNNVDNIKADDTAFSVTSIAVTNTNYCEFLQATNFNFGSYVPSGATIDGIELMISRKASVANEINDSVLYAMGFPSVIVNHASATQWGTSEGQITYGSSTDKWTSGSVTRDHIISSNFGFQLFVVGIKNGTSTASVQYMKARVYYTEGGGGDLSITASECIGANMCFQ
jgi:hypothetical protein